jgi:hypothetical protein
MISITNIKNKNKTMRAFSGTFLLIATVRAFSPTASTFLLVQRQASVVASTLFSTTTADDVVSIEPKEAVKVFGRLAEKYIMLDESGGLCCYSACKDCEFRLPDGGYRMADQSSSRPKWIPVYEERSFASQNKEHVAKWKAEIFTNGPAVTKEEFVTALVQMTYAPPLGGPYVSASAGKLESNTAAERLFEVLANGKEKLARHKMSVRLKELSGGEQGLTWPAFQTAMGIME